MPTVDELPSPSDDQPDPFEGLVLDESFVRDAKEKEGSARARMLASKWKAEPPGDTSWRPDPTPARRWYRRRPKPSAAAWAPAATARRRRGGRWWQVPLYTLLAVALVLVAMNPSGVRSWVSGHLSGHGSGDSADAGALPSVTPSPSLQAPETAPPTAAPSSPPGTPTLTDPFAGSPALTWPQGAGAIVLPAARAVGVYSSARVAEYLQKAKAFLVDTNLDPAVLGGAYPGAALALIDPDETSTISQLKQDLAHPSAKGDATDMFSRFNPKQAVLNGTVVKVQGELTYHDDGSGGLAIHADFTFVYPLRPGPDPDVSGPQSAAPAAWTTDDGFQSTDVARAIVRRIMDFDVANADTYEHTPGTLWITKYDPVVANSVCGVYNGYINPAFPESDEAGGPSPSGSAIDPYDRSTAPVDPPAGTCLGLSRT